MRGMFGNQGGLGIRTQGDYSSLPFCRWRRRWLRLYGAWRRWRQSWRARRGSTASARSCAPPVQPTVQSCSSWRPPSSTSSASRLLCRTACRGWSTRWALLLPAGLQTAYMAHSQAVRLHLGLEPGSQRCLPEAHHSGETGVTSRLCSLGWQQLAAAVTRGPGRLCSNLTRSASKLSIWWQRFRRLAAFTYSSDARAASTAASLISTRPKASQVQNSRQLLCEGGRPAYSFQSATACCCGGAHPMLACRVHSSGRLQPPAWRSS